MKHLYEIKAFDNLMGCPVVSKCESDNELTREDLIRKWNLDGPDIGWFKLYEIINGVKQEIK